MSISFKLLSPISELKGVGPRLTELFARKGVKTILDLFYFIPRKYEDRRAVTRIADAVPGRLLCMVGEVGGCGLKWYGRKKVFEVAVSDGSGLLKAKWFKGNERYLRGLFKPGRKILLTGEVRIWNQAREIIHPEFEFLEDEEEPGSRAEAGQGALSFGGIVPIYSETEGLHQKVIRKIVRQALDRYADQIVSAVPEQVLKRQGLRSLRESIPDLHFPEPERDIAVYNDMRSDSLRALIFDDFFFFELGMALRRSGNLKETGIAFAKTGSLIGNFLRLLPFELTAAQHRVSDEILSDMRRESPMNRLLMGDVGCGKTVVAMTAMLHACENGYQAALMAPTEILADQHHRQIAAWSSALGLETVLLTGSLSTREKQARCEAIGGGKANIVVGTQALIQDGAVFTSLGLAVIDEQHRFGVLQRRELRRKGPNPDVLFMTATPIPRTLALTVYGDLDVSVIDEMPPSKKAIRTKVFFERERAKVYEIIRKQMEKKNQVFVVYPLAEESESLELRDATRMAERLQKEVFPEYSVGMVHGRLKGAEKDRIMRDFADAKIDLLVSTTVVEVGIDIPQASLMVVEHAERFGLSQLHQLRGRVGRSDIPSYCILLTDAGRTEDAARRLRIMEESNDGFRIAEEDLKIRGPGEFLGTRQSGLPDFRVADIVRDARILNDARQEAFRIIESDPDLSSSRHANLREVLMRRWAGKIKFIEAG